MRLRDIPARAAVTAVLWAVGALFLVVECMAGCERMANAETPVELDKMWEKANPYKFEVWTNFGEHIKQVALPSSPGSRTRFSIGKWKCTAFAPEEEVFGWQQLTACEDSTGAFAIRSLCKKSHPEDVNQVIVSSGNLTGSLNGSCEVAK